MQSDFTFVLRCINCGIKGEIDEYIFTYQCPECGDVMKLSYIKTNIPDNKLRDHLEELLSPKKQGDIVAGRILALLADSSDSNIRNVLEKVIYEEKYCQDKHTNDSLKVSGVEKGHEERGDQEGKKANNVQGYVLPPISMLSRDDGCLE